MLLKHNPVDPSLGLVYIAEQSSPSDNVVNNLEEHRNGSAFFVSFDTNLQSFDVMNRNKRQYKGKNIWDCIMQEKIQSLIKDNAWYGEQDHPAPMYKGQELTPQRIQNVYLPNRSHKIKEPKIAGNLLTARIETASGTEAGRGFASEIIQGLVPAFSARAIANLQYIDNRPTVVVRRLITYDWVLFPSHKEAHAIGSPVGNIASLPVNESADMPLTEDIMMPLGEILEMIGHKDYNTQAVMESFDLSMDDLQGFDNSHNRVIIKDGMSKMYVNLNKESKAMVDDFFASF